MTREEYEELVDKKLHDFQVKNLTEYNSKLTEYTEQLKQELMAEFKEEEPSLDGWKVGDKYYVRFDGREIRIETIACDNEGKIYRYDVFNITHGYAKRTAEEVQFQMERDAVLYELSKFAEPKDRVWDGTKSHCLITWDFWEGGISVKSICTYKDNDIYFSTKEDAEKAIQAVGEERIKRFYLVVE